MEKVGTLFAEDGPQRSLYVCAVDDIDQLCKEVQPNSRYFALFVAVDTRRIDDRRLREVADALVGKGLVCCCAWGPDCQRVHDQIDHAAFVENSLTEGSDDVVMTTTHEGESLQEALWFFAVCAFVTPKYEAECTDWIAASVASGDWDTVIRHKLAGIATHNASDGG